MSDKLIIKTQKQLVSLIVSHSHFTDCNFCGIPLGKLVFIPVDPIGDPKFFAACPDCYKVFVTKRDGIFTRFLRLLMPRRK